ncbi:hypothetical protein DAI22_01g030600 [Oryza sativa Japonica Group]|nr:hypothetical protein DAI22_01g030600 [Oryza sativa Japonica Group]
MDVADVFDLEEQPAAAAGGEFAAGADIPRLSKALSFIGFSAIVVAVNMLVCKPPDGFLFFKNHIFAYYLLLVLIFIAGVSEIFVACWVSEGQHGRRHACGRSVFWTSLVALAVVIGLGGGYPYSLPAKLK